MTRAGERRDDGALIVHHQPAFRRSLTWHRPTDRVPEVQWTEHTGMTRYEWARRQTPDHQRPVFERLRQAYRDKPPTPLPAELIERMHAQAITLPTGMEGFPPDVLAEVLKHEIRQATTDGWRLAVTARTDNAGHVLDHLHACHADYRTLPDWALLVRLRSWVLPDDRDAYMWLPAQTPGRLGVYENHRPNNLQLIAPRMP